MDLSKIAENAQLKTFEYIDSTEGWEVSSRTTKDTLLETKPSSDFEGTLYRCTRTFKGKFRDVYEHLTLNTKGHKAEWDKDTSVYQVLVQVDEDTQVVRRASNSLARGLVSARDFIEVVRSKVTDSYGMVTACSVELSDHGPVDKFVRAASYPWGVRCKQDPEDPEKTIFQSTVQYDLKGKLPNSLVELALPTLLLGVLKNYEHFLVDKKIISK